MLHRLSALSPLSLLLALAACSGGDTAKETGDPDDSGTTDTSDTEDTGTTMDSDSGTTGDSDTGTVPMEPSIALTAPTDGAEVETTVSVMWDVDNFVLDPDGIGMPDADGHGHVHVYVDGSYVDATGDVAYTLSDLSPGKHTIEVRLADNSHDELGISDSASVDVVSASPLIAITSPSYGSEFDVSAVELGLSVYNYTITEDVGGTPVEGEGHYHIFVDGTYFDYGTDADSAWVTRLHPGDHTIMVELVQNDHSSLSPAVTDTIEIAVSEGAPYVEVLAPMSSVDSSSWEVEVGVEDFLLSDDVGGSAVDGEGHYHIYLDDVYQLFGNTGSDWLYDVDAGAHIVKAVLAENDHAELGSWDYVRASSPEDRPGVRLDSPLDGEIVSSDFAVSVSTENFTLDPDKIGSSPEEDMGHYHVYVDGIYWTYSGEAVSVVSGVPAGDHTIEVRLANHDHSEVDPVVADTVSLTVSE